MRVSFWPDGSSPVYIDPTSSEVTELLGSGWDTIRGFIADGELCIASGYGNTHESIAKAYKHFRDVKRPDFTDEFILIHAQHLGYMNWTSCMCQGFKGMVRLAGCEDKVQKLDCAIEDVEHAGIKSFLKRTFEFLELTRKD